MVASVRHFVVDPQGVVTRPDERPHDLPDLVRALMAQEVEGRRRTSAHSRVEQLAADFGFELEPWAEPGHVRMQPWARWMHAAAEEHARQRARAVAAARDLPFDEVSGVVVVDSRSPGLRAYLDLIHDDGSLYGPEPYALGGSRSDILLRQTACLQKFAIATGWDLERSPLPRCLFEVSDSFRGEPDGDVETLFRVRRFRLPEAHVHDPDLSRALAGARELHDCLTAAMDDLETDHVLLVSCSHDTWERRRAEVCGLVARSGRWALVLVSPPGALCQDGIELDFEYKYEDVAGVPRELATFQLDTLITRAIGLTVAGSDLTTAHVVPSGSVERLVHAHLDRVARLEARGVRALLPTWLAPVTARFVVDPGRGRSAAVQEMAARAVAAGARVDVDDRALTDQEKQADADRLLVPTTVRLDGSGRVAVRDLATGGCHEVEPADWLRSLSPRETASAVPAPLLSEQPRRRAGAPVTA